MTRPSHRVRSRRTPVTLAVLAVLSALMTHAPLVAAQPEALTDGNAALAYWQAFAAMPASEAELAVIDNWSTAALDGPTLNLIASPATRYALAELRRGARTGRCDWGMDYSHGPELLMPQLAKSRQLARLAMLRARHSFEQGKPRDGVVDALAAMRLGHDVGTDPILIAILVQFGLEDMSVDLLARHLPKLSPEELDQLEQTLDKLPAGDRVKQVWATESKYMVDWFEERLVAAAKNGAGDWGDRVLAMPIFGEEDRAKLKAAGVPPLEKMREQLEAIRGFYREMEPVTDLPLAEQEGRVTNLMNDVRPTSVLAQVLLPSVSRVFYVRHRAKAKTAMFRAALGVQRGGPERLKEAAYADPYGQGPFEYLKTADGFELRSQLKDETGKPLLLTVGTTQTN